MSKLSFRARALDSNKSLPVYHAEDIPDLSEYSSVNRVVPQMPTGMEKEEETEHHLQRAITAQQIYGEANRLIIPTPEAVDVNTVDVQKLRRKDIGMPKQMIHVQAFTLEDDLPDYDLDSDDEQFLESVNKCRPKALTGLELEIMLDKLEKGCGSTSEALSLNEAKLLIKHSDNDFVEKIFEYWHVKKKSSEHPALTPQVKTEKKDGSTSHDPYVAFRRRVEKMQTRKNRKNDETSYEKMLKLRRDLSRACKILDLVKKREEMKKDLIKGVVDIFKQRYKTDDFAGDLLKQCYHLLRDRQAFLQRQAAEGRITDSRFHHDEHGVRHVGSSEELRKRIRAHKRLPGQLGELNIEAEALHSPGLPTEPEDEPPGPDGDFTFKRKRGVLYHAPRYDSVGNWPWVHPVEGGSGDLKYRYCCTSIKKPRKCIGFARRRVGRGGRVIFDRAWTPFDDCSTDNDNNLKSPISPLNGVITSKSDLRVPPWPHFRPISDVVDMDDASPTTPVKKFMNSKLRRDQSEFSTSPRPSLNRSFSSQPTSKFRVNPYPTNGVCVNNQTFLSSLTSSLARVPDNHSISLKLSNGAQAYKDDMLNLNNSWTRTRLDTSTTTVSFPEHNHSSKRVAVNGLDNSGLSNNSNISSNTPQSNSSPALVNSFNSYRVQSRTSQGTNGQSSSVHSQNANHNRLPSTGPSSAVYQLNFPMLKNKASKGFLSRRQSSDASKEHGVRNSHKKNHQTPTKNNMTTVPSSPFRQVISAAVNSSPSVNVAR
eukprot:gene3635-4150_t